MMLFSSKHGRSYEDVSLILDYLKNNPIRAKHIVNKGNKSGVTNTYHLMFLFDRLHNEAVGREGCQSARSVFPIRPSQRDPTDQPHPHPFTPVD